MGEPLSNEIVAFSTLSTSLTVGSNQTVNGHVAFWNNALVAGLRATASSTTNFSVVIYTNSANAASQIVLSRSTTTQQVIEEQVFSGSGLVYRDNDTSANIHWSANNQSTTSSITLILYYRQG